MNRAGDACGPREGTSPRRPGLLAAAAWRRWLRALGLFRHGEAAGNRPDRRHQERSVERRAAFQDGVGGRGASCRERSVSPANGLYLRSDVQARKEVSNGSRRSRKEAKFSQRANELATGHEKDREDLLNRMNVILEELVKENSRLEDRIKKLESNAVAFGKVHKVKKGETLASIARKYGTSVEAIAQANGIPEDGRSRSGRRSSSRVLAGTGARSPTPGAEVSPPTRLAAGARTETTPTAPLRGLSVDAHETRFPRKRRTKS